MAKLSLGVNAISFISIACFLVSASWQASGQGGWSGVAMSDDAPNLPRLEVILDEAVASSIGGSTPKQVAMGISVKCSALWEDAWNVGVAELGSAQADMVLYGYAFRNHWAWYNGYKDSSYSFVIWKDYNCEEWIEYDSSDATKSSDQSYADTVDIAISSPLQGWIDAIAGAGNVWQAAGIAIAAIEGFSRNSITFSCIVYESLPGGSTNQFGAYFCYGGQDNRLWAERSYSLSNSNTGETQIYNILYFSTRKGHYNPLEP